MKKSYKVRFYYNNVPSKGERADSKTKTVPDLSYSIQEIIDRFSRNSLVDMDYHDPVYSYDPDDFDQDDIEKLRDSDLTDRWLKYQQLDEMRLNAKRLSRENAQKNSKVTDVEAVDNGTANNQEDEKK